MNLEKALELLNENDISKLKIMLEEGIYKSDVKNSEVLRKNIIKRLNKLNKNRPILTQIIENCNINNNVYEQVWTNSYILFALNGACKLDNKTLNMINDKKIPTNNYPKLDRLIKIPESKLKGTFDYKEMKVLKTNKKVLKLNFGSSVCYLNSINLFDILTLLDSDDYTIHISKAVGQVLTPVYVVCNKTGSIGLVLPLRENGIAGETMIVEKEFQLYNQAV